MKWIFGITLAFFFCFNLCGQKLATDAFYKKYKPQEKVTESRQVYWLEKLAPGLFLEEDAKKMLEDPSKVRIIVLPAGTASKNDLTNLRDQLPKEELALLLKAKDQKEWLELFFEVEDYRAKNILYLLQDEEEFVFLTLKGDWSLEDLIKKGRRL